MEAGPAGHDVYLANLLQQLVGADAEDVRQDAAVGDSPLQRIGHCPGLFEDLLLHVVPVLPALDGVCGHVGFLHGPFCLVVVAVANFVTARLEAHDIALVEIYETVGDRQQRMHVGGQEVFAKPDTQYQRAAGPRAHHHAGLVPADDGDRVGAAQAADGAANRLEQVVALAHQAVHEVGDDLGVGLGIEPIARAVQLFPQFLVVFDDAIVHEGHCTSGKMGVGICRGRGAVGGPARMGNAAASLNGVIGQHGFEVGDFATGARTFDAFGRLHRDSRRIVTPVFQRPQAGDQDFGYVATRRRPHDAAHVSCPWWAVSSPRWWSGGRG